MSNLATLIAERTEQLTLLLQRSKDGQGSALDKSGETRPKATADTSPIPPFRNRPGLH